jgi:hypothetical protein
MVLSKKQKVYELQQLVRKKQILKEKRAKKLSHNQKNKNKINSIHLIENLEDTFIYWISDCYEEYMAIHIINKYRYRSKRSINKKQNKQQKYITKNIEKHIPITDISSIIINYMNSIYYY